jgi:hypothetical protein
MLLAETLDLTHWVVKNFVKRHISGIGASAEVGLPHLNREFRFAAIRSYARFKDSFGVLVRRSASGGSGARDESSTASVASEWIVPG